MIDTVRNGSAAMLLCCLLGVPATAANRNVVLFVVDDQGDQAGCFGNKLIRTPSLDSLAAAGTRFTRAYCTTASCSASRSVLMTGLYNHATGHYGHAHGYNHFSTYSGVATLPVLLAFRRGNEEERSFWRRTLERRDHTEGDLQHAVQLLEHHTALADTIERARHYGAIARDALGIFADSPGKRALTDVIDFSISRAH